MENIVIPNHKELEKLKEQISEQGAERLHILADFDRTLTYAFAKGEKVPSIISILRSSGKYLGEDYAKKALALYDKYHSIETDSKIPFKEKKKAMHEWWKAHFDLIVKAGLNRSHLDEVVSSGKMRFRQGALEFFDFLHKHRIPLIIMSASGLGSDIIAALLEKEGRLYNDIYIISNSFVWDKRDIATDIKKPIIHCLNKDETILKDFHCYKAVKQRKNVLLLGDNLEDVKMIEGFDYKSLIKIGFLNENVEKNLKYYKRNYDIVILNDSSMDYINMILKEMIIDRVGRTRYNKDNEK